MTMSTLIKEDDSNECPICTDSLTLASKQYPLICPTDSCHFNMCSTCLEQLCKSSNSALGKASDGSYSVRVRLQCPSCRGDLGKTARCTLILRESVEAELLQDVNDSELNAAELRLKYLLDDPEELGRVSAAKRTYEKSNGENGFEFMHDSGQFFACGSAMDSAPLPDFGSEEFLEELKEEPERIRPTTVDVTVFSGLEHAMTLAEKDFVYSLITSGRPRLLVEAVETLDNIAEMALKGLTPSRHERDPVPLSKSNSSDSNMSASPSRYQKSSIRSGYSCSSRPKQIARRVSNDQEIEEAKEAARLAAWKRIRPLPVRMPRAFSVDLDKFGDVAKPSKCCLNFIDYVETSNDKDKDYRLISDAYRKFEFSYFSANILRKPLDKNFSEGVKRMVESRILSRERISLDQSCHSTSSIHTTIVNPPSRRIVVKSARHIAAQKGIQPGDVITHINGEPFLGGSEELRRLISKLQRERLSGSKDQKNGEKLSVVVNAEISVAEALRLRTTY